MFEQRDKTNTDLDNELAASSRLCFQTYRGLCEEFTAQMADLIS